MLSLIRSWSAKVPSGKIYFLNFSILNFLTSKLSNSNRPTQISSADETRPTPHILKKYNDNGKRNEKTLNSSIFTIHFNKVTLLDRTIQQVLFDIISFQKGQWLWDAVETYEIETSRGIRH